MKRKTTNRRTMLILAAMFFLLLFSTASEKTVSADAGGGCPTEYSYCMIGCQKLPSGMMEMSCELQCESRLFSCMSGYAGIAY